MLFHLTSSYSILIQFLLHFFSSTADSDAGENEQTTQDILTCGSCQKTFSLGDIVKFIQHKVLQCNKENYGQCFSQGKEINHSKIVLKIF